MQQAILPKVKSSQDKDTPPPKTPTTPSAKDEVPDTVPLPAKSDESTPSSPSEGKTEERKLTESSKNKRISVKIFLRLISPPCAQILFLFLLTKSYKGSLYLLVTLEKFLDIIFALFFLLESSKPCPVRKPPFCLAWPHLLYVVANC